MTRQRYSTDSPKHRGPGNYPRFESCDWSIQSSSLNCQKALTRESHFSIAHSQRGIHGNLFRWSGQAGSLATTVQGLTITRVVARQAPLPVSLLLEGSVQNVCRKQHFRPARKPRGFLVVVPTALTPPEARNDSFYYCLTLEPLSASLFFREDKNSLPRTLRGMAWHGIESHGKAEHEMARLSCHYY